MANPTPRSTHSASTQHEWRGGLELSSKPAAFGGWSGLALDPGGKKLVAVSDVGHWMTADIEDNRGDLSGLASIKLGPLFKQNG